ncbi:hypothetical protein DSL72_006485 [Monilinia vaccinii-corymbosi]|uniref:Uncharacterized protein n=1 Tax=Monilinia vaccinii-corymbosi TaxID=61207 RepID=A0A8A3PNV3_9HELO|nr:hypothetical protein DSL72_006485 [Monilinia vaccinii-corymbosi]
MTRLTWLITGCSSGFGEQLTHSILARGDLAIATTRGPAHRIQHLRDAGAATLSLDVTESQSALDAKVHEALQIYEGIDVLINNAGYVEAGLIETVSQERLETSLHVNLFGPLNLTRSLLPHFRARKAGTIMFIGSVCGWQGEMGVGAYVILTPRSFECAAKFGLEGIVEVLQKETARFGIRTIILEPGYFRTRMSSPANIKWEPTAIPDYEPVQNTLASMLQTLDRDHPGDPKKAAERIVDIVRREGLAAGKETPPRVPLGPDSLQRLKDKCLSTLKMLEEWEPLITSTGLDA